MTVPGPTRTRSSLSFCLLIADLTIAHAPEWRVLSSRPEGKAEAGAGTGRCPVARDIARPGDIEMLGGAGDADPHADLGAAGVELMPRQGLQRLGILADAGVEQSAVELLVDDEMAEAARADNAHPRIAGIALDRLADRLAQLVAAPRRRLVRR